PRRPRVEPGADPHGHPAPRDRRDRRAQAPPGRRRHPRDPGDRGDGVRDDPQPPGDPGRRLRRVPVQADQHPGVPGDRPDHPGPRAQPGGRPVTTPARILVVDDTPLNVRLLVDLLTAKGYEVVTAASGPEALQRVEVDRPDLVLLDVVMPGMSGYEVCQ